MASARLQIFEGKFADHAKPPAPLRRLLPQEDWDDLAGRVEDALLPDIYFQWVGLGVCICLLLSIVVCFLVQYSSSSSSTSYSEEHDNEQQHHSTLGLPVMMLPIFLFVIFFVMGMTQQCYIRPQVMTAVNCVLGDYSNKYPGVSFHLMGHGSRTKPFLIEVYVDGSHYRELGNSNSNVPSTSTRLVELEKVRHLLSEQEYSEKRQSILADI